MIKKNLTSYLIIIFLFTNLISCREKKQSPFAPGTPISLVLNILLGLRTTPTFSPAPGQYAESIKITISNSEKNKGIPIHYTTDGSVATCLSTRYDSNTGVNLELGRIYNLNAVECFEGFASKLGSGEYIVGFCQNYLGVVEGYFNIPTKDNFSYSPTTLGFNQYSISPSIDSCINLNPNSGIISGQCQNTIAEQEYRISRVLSSGNGEVQTCLARIKVYEWVNEAYLKAPNAEANDRFGASVSISGDTIVVGASAEDSTQTIITNGTLVQASDRLSNLAVGAAYVFRRTGTIWANEAYLKAPNAEGASPNGDNFGLSVAISGNTIVVGVPPEDSLETTITNGTLVQISDVGTTNSGAAYVFRRTGNIWTNEAYLKAPNAEAGDQFGNSVSISGDTIVVGAMLESSNQTTVTNGNTGSSDNSAISSGAAYVYRRTGTIWSNEAYLKAPNAEGLLANTGDQFGRTVSISEDRIVVGCPNEDSLLTTITNGTLVQTSDVGTTNSGAAYVFRRTGTTWVNEAYLKAPNAEAGDGFGFSVAISGDTIVASSVFEDSIQTTITNGTIFQTNDQTSNLTVGAAYVFRRTGTTWTNEAYLKAPNAEGGSPSGDRFTSALDISGDTILVGAINEDSTQTTITNGTLVQISDHASNLSVGAAYVFKRIGTKWINEAYLKAPNAESGDNFSGSLSISGDTIVIGASSESSSQTTITNGTTASADNSASNAGAVYVFRLK